MKYLPTTAVLLWIIVAGCSPDNPYGLPPHVVAADSVVVIPENPAGMATVKLEKEIAFRDSLLLEGISTVAVGDDGSVLFAGSSWNRTQIHIFNRDGTYTDSLGNYGSRDGEFLEVRNLQLVGDTLYVFDTELGRVTIFNSKTGNLISVVNPQYHGEQLPNSWNGFHASPIALLNNSSFLTEFKRDRNPAYESSGDIQYYAADYDGAILSSKILSQKDLQYIIGDYAGRPAPFTLSLPERPLLSVAENGRIYSAYTEEFFINVYEPNGDYLYSYYSDIERYSLDPNEVIHPRFSHNDQLLRVRESAVYPEKWPALHSMAVDDVGNLWVSTITSDREQLKWWIIEEETGEVTATFYRPTEKPIVTVKDNSVYTIETGNSGFKEVVRYGYILE